MLFDVFIPILALLSLAALWLSSMEARERARSHASRLCEQANLQLLDQTVSLRRLRLRRPAGRSLRLQREYGFEVSSDGSNRLPGQLRLVGYELQGWSLPDNNAHALP